jgi:hypothetical protein
MPILQVEGMYMGLFVVHTGRPILGTFGSAVERLLRIQVVLVGLVTCCPYSI